MSFNLPNKSNLDLSDTVEFWDRSGSDPQRVEITQENLKNNLEGVYTGNLSTVSDLNDSDTYVIWDKSGASPQKSEITRENVIHDVSRSDAYNGRSIVTEGGSRSATSNSTALNDTLSNSKKVLFPEGTWNFDAGSSIFPRTKDITIEGDGATSTILKRNSGSGKYMFDLQNSGGTVEDIQFKNLTIDARGDKNTTCLRIDTRTGSGWGTVAGVEFVNVRFLVDGTVLGDPEAPSSAIKIFAELKRSLKFQNCEFIVDQGNNGDDYNSHSLRLSLTDGSGSTQKFDDRPRLKVQNCEFSGGRTFVNVIPNVDKRGPSIFVTGNEFHDSPPTGPGVRAYHCSHVEVSNNTFIKCGSSSQANSDGGIIWVDTSKYDSSELYDTNTKLERGSITIADNDFRSIVGNAIYVEDTQGGSITGNEMTNVVTRKLKFRPDSNTDDQFIDSPTGYSSKGGHGIVVGGGTSGLSITDNRMSFLQGAAIHCASELSAKSNNDPFQWLSIKGNYVKDCEEYIKLVRHGDGSDITNNIIRGRNSSKQFGINLFTTIPASASIVNVNTTDNEISISGDYTSEFESDDEIVLFNHPTHTGVHELSGSVSLDGFGNTIVPVNTDLTDGTVQGFGAKVWGKALRIANNYILRQEKGITSNEPGPVKTTITSNIFEQQQDVDVEWNGFIGSYGNNFHTAPGNIKLSNTGVNFNAGDFRIEGNTTTINPSSNGLGRLRTDGGARINGELQISKQLGDGDSILEYFAHKRFNWRRRGASDSTASLSLESDAGNPIEIGGTSNPQIQIDPGGNEVKITNSGKFLETTSDPSANGEIRRNGTTLKAVSDGNVKNFSNIGTQEGKLTQSISSPPTQSEVQAIQTKINNIIDDIGQ